MGVLFINEVNISQTEIVDRSQTMYAASKEAFLCLINNGYLIKSKLTKALHKSWRSVFLCEFNMWWLLECLKLLSYEWEKNPNHE